MDTSKFDIRTTTARASFTRGFSTDEGKARRSATRLVFCASDNDRDAPNENEFRLEWQFTMHIGQYDSPVVHVILVRHERGEALAYNVARALAKIEAVRVFPGTPFRNCCVINLIK